MSNRGAGIRYLPRRSLLTGISAAGVGAVLGRTSLSGTKDPKADPCGPTDEAAGASASGYREVRTGKALKAAIESGHSGTIKVTKSGVISVPNPVDWSRSYLKVEGTRGTNLRRADPDQPMFRFGFGPRKLFKCELEGFRAFDAEWGGAPWMHNVGEQAVTNASNPGETNHAIIDQFTFRDIEWKNIGSRGVMSFNNCTRLTVENCHFDACQGDILTLYRPADPHITGCTFELKGPGYSHNGVACKFIAQGEPRENGGARLLDTVFMRGDRSLHWEGIWQVGVHNCVFDGHDKSPLFTGVKAISMSRNSSTGWQDAPCMVIIGGDNHRISDNRFEYSPNDEGLRVENADDVIIANNIARHCQQGIRVAGCRNVQLEQNNCTDNTGSGLVLSATGRGVNDSVTLVGGQYHENGGHGMNIDGRSWNVDVRNVQAHRNRLAGVRVAPGTHNITVVQSTSRDNGTGGLLWGDPTGDSQRVLNVT